MTSVPLDGEFPVNIINRISRAALPFLACAWFCSQAFAADVKEQAFDAPHQLKVRVRMEGPYTADVPLQIVCYKYTPEGAKRMSGAPVELDKELGGVIASLRERGEFVGDELETLLIIPPNDSIKAKALLLIGLGPEENLSLDVLERVGKAALREAARLGAKQVAFAPLLRDQGNSKIPTGDVEIAVLRGMLLAYDTNQRMQKEGVAKSFTLESWNVEAGQQFFDETATSAEQAIARVNAALRERSTDAYRQSK
jgi:hypothetical protein